MGPSGSGKTTLLNVLARRPLNITIDENVRVNGVQPSEAAFRHITSFVEDHDSLIGSLTVRETLEFASKLAGVR
jgi:ABC-type multidrug transport system ATPase subunit